MRSLKLLLLFSVLATVFSLTAETVNEGTPEFFENKIRPILANNCFGCHTNSQLGGLRLDTLDGMKKGGKRGPAIVPGDPDSSLLIKAVRQTDAALKMPYGSKLTASEIADLEAWVKAGAIWPASTVSAVTSSKDGKYVISPERRNFWSFLPLKNPAVPAVKDTKWPKTDIDRFVLARMEQEGIKPVAPATKHDLIRRASLDLTGLLPTTEEEAAFENDNSPSAFAKVVDRLLASPHYGERWGRLWLDVARYGDSTGYEFDLDKAEAWRYRDYVIKAFNEDKPYNQFILEQLAGDELDQPTFDSVIATGFLRLGPRVADQEDANANYRFDYLDDMVRTTYQGLQGLSLNCARCHDHKFDPITRKDYYKAVAIFNSA